MIRDRSDLHNYQNQAIEFSKNNPKSGLFLDMGLGKTTTSLTIASDLLDDLKITRVLIIGPLRVANTVWKQEAAKWSHLSHLKISICTGTPKARLGALNPDYDIHIINRENIQWLVSAVPWQWDMVIIDESTSFKNHKTQRFKALRKVTKYLSHVILLSGRPSPGGLEDLWPQMYIIDNGARLGKTITNYRQRFFKPLGYMGYGYEPKKDAYDQVQALIKDVCITMDSADYLELPDRLDITTYIELPKNVQDLYSELKKEFLMTLSDGTDIETPSSAALVNKLLQICNGAVYDENGDTHNLHDEKLKAVKDIIDDNPDENFLIAYNFKSDLVKLKSFFPDLVVLSTSGDELVEWNKGNIKMLACHPASAGHGLNAQYGGSVIIWYGLNWSLELYDQFNARLHRQGQTKPVRIIHLVAKGCVDELVLSALGSKAKSQRELIEYLSYKLTQLVAS